MQLIRELSRPNKVVLAFLLTFYAWILAWFLVGFFYEMMTTSLQLGRTMASTLGGTC